MAGGGKRSSAYPCLSGDVSDSTSVEHEEWTRGLEDGKMWEREIREMWKQEYLTQVLGSQRDCWKGKSGERICEGDVVLIEGTAGRIPLAGCTKEPMARPERQLFVYPRGHYGDLFNACTC